MVVGPTRGRALALGVTLALLTGLVACTSDEPAAAPVRTTVEQIWTTRRLASTLGVSQSTVIRDAIRAAVTVRPNPRGGLFRR